MIKHKKEENLRHKKCQNTFLCVLKWATGIVAAIMLILVLISLLPCCKLNVCSEHFYHWAELFIITFTLSVAVQTYQRSKKVEEANMLINLRKLLMSKDNMTIHKKLLGQFDSKDCTNDSISKSDSFWNSHLAEVYNYLGTLELMDILLEDDVLTEEDFRQQFSYRVEDVADDESLQSFLKKENSSYWTRLNKLINKVKQSKTTQQ